MSWTPPALARILPLLGFTAGLAAAGEPEGLVLRVHDAVARPGHVAAIVLSTYEPLPIEQGQICLSVGNGPTGTPDKMVVLDELGDTRAQALEAPGGELMIRFESPSGTINTSDGPMVVLYFEVSEDAIPGQVLPIRLDALQSFLRAADGSPIPVSPEEAELTVVHPDSRYLLSTEGDKIRPGQRAEIAVETSEPLGLTAGRLTLRYPPEIAAGPPQVRVRSKSVELEAVTELEPGRVAVEIRAAAPSWNRVPGPLLEVYLPTSPSVPIGTEAALTLDAEGTDLQSADGRSVPWRLDAGEVEFRD